MFASLQDAEETVVACCIDYEHAMRHALTVLPLRPFRSEVADDLDLIFYTLAGWLASGRYDGIENRENLMLLAEPDSGRNRDYRAWLGYLYWLQHPQAVFPDYARHLIDMLAKHYRLADAQLKAAREFRDLDPFGLGQATPQPVAPGREPRRKGGQHMGGIVL